MSDERDDRLEAYALATGWREEFFPDWDGSVSEASEGLTAGSSPARGHGAVGSAVLGGVVAASRSAPPAPPSRSDWSSDAEPALGRDNGAAGVTPPVAHFSLDGLTA